MRRGSIIETAFGPKRQRTALEDHARVFVVGGGPAGAFFALTLLRGSRSLGKTIELVIFEKKRELQFYRPTLTRFFREGCNYCAGGISPRLADTLEEMGLRLPEEIQEGTVDSLTVHENWKNIELQIPPGRKMLSVFRGSRPKSRPGRHANFDTFLLEKAVEEGANVVIDVEDMTPVTYVNSTASLKAFCGRHGGIVCTSANADKILKWAFERTSRVLFCPDQHLGRNTSLKMGITNDQMPIWNPHDDDLGGNAERAIRDSRVVLWQGHCSVHQMFRPEHVYQFRERIPDIKILVHPECPQEVNDLADESGSTGKIIKAVEQSPPGTRWAIGTELHLVNRLKHEHPEQEIHFLSPVICICATMYRIDLAHLCWSLENLAAGNPVNVIEVDKETSRWSLVALERMLEVTEAAVPK